MENTKRLEIDQLLDDLKKLNGLLSVVFHSEVNDG